MDARDVALLVVSGYVAVTALVRLMLARHRALLAELRRHLAAKPTGSPANKRASRAA